jgi:hypothetical protein
VHNTKWISGIIAAAAIGMSLSSAAFADDTAASGSNGGIPGGSQFFYQTAAGHQALTPVLDYQTWNIDATDDNQTLSGLLVNLGYEYGLNDMLSVGANIGYTNQTASETGLSNTTINGLQNIDLYVRGTLAAGVGSFKYGADLSISPGDRTISSNGNLNAATGGHSITPYVGYQMMAGPGTVGAKLSTQIDIGDRTTSQSGLPDQKFSGSDQTEFDVFYEQRLAQIWMFGAALNYDSYSDTKHDGGGTLSNYSPFIGLKVYSVVNVGPGELLPMIQYQWTSDTSENGNTISSYNKIDVAAGYRWTF